MDHSPSLGWVTSVLSRGKLPMTSPTSPPYLQVEKLRHRKRTFLRQQSQPACTEFSREAQAPHLWELGQSWPDYVLCLGEPGPLTVAPFGPVIPWGPRIPSLPCKVDRHAVTVRMLNPHLAVQREEWLRRVTSRSHGPSGTGHAVQRLEEGGP